MTRKILPLFIDPTKTNTVTEGVATTGQISPKGTVSHTEHWDGRMDATVRPATIRNPFAAGIATAGPVMPGTLTDIGKVTL